MSVQVDLGPIIYRAQEFRLRSGHATELGFFRAFAENLERQFQLSEGFDDQVKTLVGHEPSTGQPITAGYGRKGNAGHIDRRMDHRGFAAVVAADA